MVTHSNNIKASILWQKLTDREDADEGLGPVLIDFDTTDDGDEGRETTAGAESTSNENEEEPSQAETARPQPARQTIHRQWQPEALGSTYRLTVSSHTTADSTATRKYWSTRTFCERCWTATRGRPCCRRR